LLCHLTESPSPYGNKPFMKAPQDIAFYAPGSDYSRKTCFGA
jgi:hypothetical protein